MDGKRERWYHLCLLAVALATVAGGIFLHVEQETVCGCGVTLPSACLMSSLLPQGCPGCGLTRGIIAFFHGNWHASLVFHPAAGLLALIAAGQIPYRLLRLRRQNNEHPALNGAGTAGRHLMLVVLLVSMGRWLGAFFF